MSTRALVLAGALAMSAIGWGAAPVGAAERSVRVASAGMVWGAAPTSASSSGLPSCDFLRYDGDAGYITVQTGPTGYLQWGIYMHNPAEDAGPWWVDVYISKDATSTRRKDRVDHKEQEYAPHGRVHPRSAKSGKVFHVRARHIDLQGRESRSVTNGCVIP